MSANEDTIKMLVRLPADLRQEIERIAQGGQAYPPTSNNAALIFLLRAGLRALGKSPQEAR